MITFSQGVDLLQKLTGINTNDTANTALLTQFWNDSRRTVSGMNGGRWRWLEVEETVLTVANQSFVYIPNDIRKVAAVRVVIGSSITSVKYLPRLIFDPMIWQRVLQANLGYSDIPFYVFQQGQKLLFAPTPKTAGNYVVITGRQHVRDISIVDYVTGTIVSIAKDATTVVGSGTAWTASMAGRYIRITESDTANKGDGFWYKVASVTNATTLELEKPYQGTSIVAGAAAYILGQITYEPEIYQMAPIYRAVAQFWDMKENMVLSERYWRAYDGGQEIGKSDLPGGIVGQMLEEQGETMEGPYVAPWQMDNNGKTSAPYYLPFMDATGF